MQQRLSLTESLILILTTVIVVVGFVLFFIDPALFVRYTYEDGLVEWLTVFGLLLGAGVCVYRFIKLLGRRSWIFLAVTLLLGTMLFVVAGEEVSWGQRIFGIESSDFFRQNNLQKETNFHNMVVNGVKINKVIFTFGLIAALGIFLLILPYLYKRNARIKAWADSWGIMIPRNYQIIAFLLLFATTALLKHEKNAEVLECGAGLLFFLIVRYPFNKEIFSSTAVRKA